MPLVRRTRATLRSAEFGFFGVLVYTRVHTPRRWGAPFRAAVLPLAGFDSRPLRTSCWLVGTGVLRKRGSGGGGHRPAGLEPPLHRTGGDPERQTSPALPFSARSTTCRVGGRAENG